MVTNPDAQSGTRPSGFTYVGPAPTVTSVAPASGPTPGGTGVTITGTNFVAGATVTLGGSAATGVTVASSTTITATTPAHAAGAVAVVVINLDAQSGTLPSGFTYVAPAPTVSGVAPVSGPVAGGTPITITGANFVAGATVTLGGSAATGVTVLTSTTMSATTPAHAAGAVAIVVTNPDTQTGTLPGGFTYNTAPAPTVTSVAPTSGSTAGGTAITVTGTNFAAGATLTLGGTPATGVAVVTGTTITATAPAHTAGAVAVTVTNADAQSGSLPSGYTYTTSGPAMISFVQVNSAVPSSGSSVAVPFTAAQTAGNLNVVVVGWNDTTRTVTNVTDSRGNTYVRAVGPTAVSGALSQSIYYAKNIVGAAAGANVVTVQFSASAYYPDIRVLEYSGLDLTNPLDVTAAATGSTATSSSGAVTTTNANDLLVGANMVATRTAGAGAGFTSRIITVPDGDIAEDQVVTSVGSYSAVAPLTGGGPWIMQLVAFKAASAVPDTNPPSPPSSLTASPLSESQVGLSWMPSTDDVGVTSYLVERCQGEGCVTFAQVGSAATPTFGDSGLAANTPYRYRVRATDAAGNLSGYSNMANVTTLAPDTEPPSAPGVLEGVAVSGTEIDLSWGPATDNVGVSGYRVERCQGAGCSGFVKLGVVAGTTYSDTALAPNTLYRYIVRASDLAGNLGPYSNVVTITTLDTIPQLVAAYSFDEGVGTAIGDSSQYANNGAVSSAAWSTTGKYGSALVFNGTSSLVTIPSSPSLNLNSAMTLEAWVQPTAAANVWRDVIYKADDLYYLEGASPTGSPVVGVSTTSSHANLFGVSPLPAGTWTHLAATYDGTTLRLYVNGVQASTLAHSGNVLSGNSPLQIGGDSLYGQHFQGLIDEVRVYNVALTPTQIQADMNTPLGGAFPVLGLSSSALDFGSYPTGTTSSPLPVTVTNVGGATLNINGIAITGVHAADFAQSNDCAAPLAAGQQCTITTQFTPGATGTRVAAITISDNGIGAPHSIALTGAGIGFSIAPRTAVVTSLQQQQFSASGGSTGTVTWSVDGVLGGTAASGTISSTGLYSPPSSEGTHTVTATDAAQVSNATVFVTNYPGVLTHHNDNFRTGQNLNEIVLGPSNVNPLTFGKLLSYPIDGLAHASPLYVAGVNIPGQGFHNVVYVATEHDSVYAFDADGAGPTPLWYVNFTNPGAGITTVPADDTGECCDVAPEIGITGTPVIDSTTGTLYVVAKTKEVSGGNTNYRQRLHALDITTGAEKFGGPVLLQATVAGTGQGSSGGQLAFDALRENQRPALLLLNGVVYIGFGSHGDHQPYHGWLLGYNASTLAQVMAYCATRNGEGAGMWQANGGPAADAAGNIFFITGDGSFNANTGGPNFGDSFVKVNAAGTVVDYFTPHNQANLDVNNFDLGAAGPLLLPDQPGAHPHLMISAGKDNAMYLVDRDNMGHYNASNDSQIVQSLVNIFPFGTPEPGNYSAAVYFNGTVYFSPIADTIQAFRLTNGLLSVSPTSRSSQNYAYPGGSMAVSANGSANGILWAVQRNATAIDDQDASAPGVLHAYDANDLSVELYNSDQAGTRDTLPAAAKFSVPLVANGKVFVATVNSLTVYGLLP